MEKRFFEKIGYEVPLFGFGLMRLPMINSTTVDYPVAEAMIERALSGGINYFDTGRGYLGRKSENLVGDVLSRYPRNSYFLADKLPAFSVKSEKGLDFIFNEQLEKCKTDYFDFYLFHNFRDSHHEISRKFGIYEYLRRKKSEGIIRHLGFSFHETPKNLLRLVSSEYDWDFAQIQLNYLDWEDLAAHEQYRILYERGIPIVVMEPLRGGSLVNLPPDARAVLEKANPKATPASWGLRFAASHPGVMTVLSGMNSMEQLEENIDLFSNFQPLSGIETKVLEETAKAVRATKSIPCTGCRYCMECPHGVDIPKVFAVYNLARANENERRFMVVMDRYSRYLDAASSPKNCVGCGKCVSECPQNIDIPKIMKEISVLLDNSIPLGETSGSGKENPMLRERFDALFDPLKTPEYREPVGSATVIPDLVRRKPYSVIVYGAGALGYLNVFWLRRNGIEPMLVVDGDKEKDGTDFFGVPVCHIDSLSEKIQSSPASVLAVVAVTAWETDSDMRERIKTDLLGAGCAEALYNKSPMVNPKTGWSFHFAQYKDRFFSTLERLADEESRETFLEYMRSMMHGDFYRRPTLTTREKYFSNELYKWLDDEVFVDCGAYCGDSIFNFVNMRDTFAAIHSFECNSRYYEELQKNIEYLPEEIRKKIHTYHVKLGKEGDSSLDALLKGKSVSLVKMDLEGVEDEVLKGAGALIRTHNPVLAICAYHRWYDLTRLPALISKYQPRYKLFVRKYNCVHLCHPYSELVLYAVPPTRLVKAY